MSSLIKMMKLHAVEELQNLSDNNEDTTQQSDEATSIPFSDREVRVRRPVRPQHNKVS